MTERDLVAGIVQLGNVLTRRLAPVFARNNVTPQQWAVLCAIARADAPLSLAALAREMLVSKQNMTGMVARLEQLGFAERSGHPDDLRSSRLGLTRRGRTVVERLRPVYEQWIEETTADRVSTRELQTLQRTVDRLIEALEAEE